MSTFDYVSVLRTARTLIERFGRPCSISRLDETSSDPTKPWDTVPGATIAATTCLPAVFVDPSSARSLGLFAQDDALLRRFESFAIAAPLDRTPDLRRYQLLDDPTLGRFQIGYISRLAPGDVVMLWYMGLKR